MAASLTRSQVLHPIAAQGLVVKDAMAWFVQNPDKHAGVVLVLKSREQRTGESTVGRVMLDIFGQHGFLVRAEEILFAGDLKSADKMKSMITSDTLQVERKFGSCRQVPNRMKVIATTNHDHAIAAGVRDRRYVVYDVSNEHVGDQRYFDALYRDLDNGGTREFLWLLQNVRLGNWHPRMTIKMAETAEQQRMSGDGVSQWAGVRRRGCHNWGHQPLCKCSRVGAADCSRRPTRSLFWLLSPASNSLSKQERVR